MNPEDVRKLIGGYATGSLSEAERKALFDAALDDQELFDELAGEQVLKEILEEPGARQRLLSALGAEAKLVQAPWWSRSWPWMGAAVTVAVAIIIVVAQRTPVPQPPAQQIARVLKSAEPVAAPPATPPPPPAPARVAPKALRKDAPGPPAPAALADTPKPSVDAVEEARSDKAQVQAAAPAPPQQAPQAARQAVGVVGGAAGFAAGGRAQNETVTVTIGPVVFSYAVGVDGFVQVVPVETGFVSISAEFTDRDVVVFPSTEVAARTPARVQIPANATGLIIGFSKTSGVNDSRIGRPLVPGLAFDVDPPTGKVRIEVPAKP